MFIRKLPSPSISTTSSIGMGDLGPDRGGQAEAHRPQAAAGKPGPRLAELVELGRPHLVLAHARR